MAEAARPPGSGQRKPATPPAKKAAPAPPPGGKPWSHTLGLWASALALVTFAGFPTYRDLFGRLFPQTAPKSAAELRSDQQTYYRTQYRQVADTQCRAGRSANPKVADTASARDYRWLWTLVNVRHTVLLWWQAVSRDALSSADEARLGEVWRDYADMDRGLAKAAADSQAANGTQYNLDRDDYVAARTSFLGHARSFGFVDCVGDDPMLASWS